jgi:hypothetical protein
MPVDSISGDFRHYVLYHVLDPHDRKPWAMCWVALHRSGTAYVVDEYPNRDFNEMQFDDKTYDDYAEVIRDKEENLSEIFGCSVRTRIIDPNFGNKTVQLAERQGGQSKTTPQKELSKRGFKFKDGIDSLEAGHLAVRQALYWQKKDEEVVVQPSIMVLENCINTIAHLQKYSYKDIFTASGEEKPKVGPRQEYKDFCDLIRYWKMSNPRYAGINREVTLPGKAY